MTGNLTRSGTKSAAYFYTAWACDSTGYTQSLDMLQPNNRVREPRWSTDRALVLSSKRLARPVRH